MSKKSARPTGFQEAICSKCSKVAVTVKGKTHRWCGGDKANRKKGKPGNRGTWQ